MEKVRVQQLAEELVVVLSPAIIEHLSIGEGGELFFVQQPHGFLITTINPVDEDTTV